MKQLLLIISVLFTSVATGQHALQTHQLVDSSSSRTSNNPDSSMREGLRMHGFTVHGFIKIPDHISTHWYSIGYEYVEKRKKNAFVFGSDLSLQKLHRYLNGYVGIKNYYEYGNNWGGRFGFDMGYSFTPKLINSSPVGSIPPNSPYIQGVSFAPLTAIFYRTKNYRWQFILSTHTQLSINQFLSYQEQTIERKWISEFPLFSVGFMVKYNFKTYKK